MVKSRSDSRRRPSRTPGMAEWRRAAEARAEEMYNLMVPSAILTKLPPPPELLLCTARRLTQAKRCTAAVSVVQRPQEEMDQLKQAHSEEVRALKEDISRLRIKNLELEVLGARSPARFPRSLAPVAPVSLPVPSARPAAHLFCRTSWSSRKRTLTS